MKPSDERLPAKAIRWLNKELAAQGLRVCVRCQGHPQPLDDAHFCKSKGYYSHVCNTCAYARNAARAKERYHSDADFRAYRRAHTAQWRREHPEYVQAWEQAKVGRKKTAALKRALGKAQP